MGIEEHNHQLLAAERRGMERAAEFHDKAAIAASEKMEWYEDRGMYEYANISSSRMNIHLEAALHFRAEANKLK